MNRQTNKTTRRTKNFHAAMGKKKRNVDKLGELLGGTVGGFSDGSATWVTMEDHDHDVEFVFDGRGMKLQGVMLARKVYEVVDHKVIAKIDRE